MRQPRGVPRRNERRAYLAAEIRRLRQLDRRLGDLRRSTRALVLVELPSPIRAGWTRYFFVRPDLAHSPEGPALARLLPVVQQVEFSNRKDFAVRDWSKGGKKRPTEHQLRALREGEFLKLPEELRHYFKGRVETLQNGRRELRFSLKEPWKYATRTRAYYLTHRALPNAEAESELRHIESQLYGPGYPFRHLLRQWGSSWGDYGDDSRDGPSVDEFDENLEATPRS